MAFADDYLQQLERFARCGPLPRVKALHLPPRDPESGKWGEFCALELADGSLGLSYVMLDDTLTRLIEEDAGRQLAGVDALQLASGYQNGSGLARTLGFAAANALTRCLFDRAGYRPPESTDSIGGLDPQPADHLGMIGYFAPIAGRIVALGARLTVVELRAELTGSQAGFEITLDATRLAACNKILSTSTILLNDTLDRMLGLCTGAERIAMIGPGAGCLPDALFARGVTLLGGSWIEDREALLDALPRGESWGRFTRKTAILAADYPGLPALLARLA